MDIDVRVALIAGGISFTIAILSYLSSLQEFSKQREELERKIQNQFTDRLYPLRLEHYPKAFILTEKIQRRSKPQQIVEQAELKKIADELYAWKTGIVSLIISQSSLGKFFTLRDALIMGYGENDKFTDSQVERIMRARNQFRSSLRKDIGLLYEEDELND